MRLRFAPKSKRIATILAGVLLVFRVIDWLVGKLGYLGVFTSPEDFKTMMERAPIWMGSVWVWVVWLGEKAGIVWGFAISPGGTMAMLALIFLVLMIDMNKVTRLTRGLWFNVRHAVSERVWISRTSAIDLIKESEWGQLITPFEATIFGYNALAALQHRKSGLSDSEKIHLKFRVFLDRCLRAFAESNYNAHRINDSGHDEYDEVALRAYLDKALDSVIEKEFGKPPTHQVS